MSIRPQTSTPNCKYCGQHITDFYAPGYCSPLCYYKYQGEKLYNTVRHDHRWCATCGRRLKEVEAPSQAILRKINGIESTRSLRDGGGYQYRTPNADIGEKPIQSSCGERITTGTICGKCGNATTHKAFPEVQDEYLEEYGTRIFDVIADKEDEHEGLDRELFFEMLAVTGDLVFSLGKAKEGH